MRLLATLVVLLVGLVVGTATPATAQEPTCTRPISDAEALTLAPFGAPSPIFVLDDPHLSVVVLAQPGAPDASVAAISAAIEEWDSVLQQCFDGALSITEISGGPRGIRNADVVLRYTLHRGGRFVAGSAVCLPERCDVFVSSQSPNGQGGYTYTPLDVYNLALHELGHVLGLGHTTNLFESVTDLMGYGWGPNADIEISQCNVEALAYVWGWLLEGGTEPERPAEATYDC